MQRRTLAAALGCAWLAGCGARPAPVSLFSEQDARVVLEPQRFGWLSSAHETGALPSAIAIGARTTGRLLLYFEFAQPNEPRKLLRAQLLLDSAQGPGEPVTVELSRSDAPGAELRRWSDQPRARYPRVSTELSAQAFPVRLDVTEILRVPPERGEPLRLLLRAEPGDGEGVLIATGASGGALPRLELYFQ